MHASLPAWVVLCTQICLVCSPNSIDTFIFLIQPDLAEIWAQACKQIACMHAALPAPVKLCAQRGLAYSPHSIDTLISLIWPHLAEIWAFPHKHVTCMLRSNYVLREVRHNLLKACFFRSNYVLREVQRFLLIPYILWSLWFDPIWLRYEPKPTST